MAKVEIKVNEDAILAILRGPEVQADLKRRADRIAETAGPGNASEVVVGSTRARGHVWTDTNEAKVAEATERTLTRALDAGR